MHCFYLLFNIHPTLTLGLSLPLSNTAHYWALLQSLVHVLSSVIFTMRMINYYICFILNEAEAQRAYVICLRSHSWWVAELGFWIFHPNGIIQHVAFCVWLLSLCMMVLWSIFQALSNIWILSLLKVFHYMAIPLCVSIHQLMDIWMVSISGWLWMVKQWTFMHESYMWLITDIFCHISYKKWVLEPQHGFDHWYQHVPFVWLGKLSNLSEHICCCSFVKGE